MIIQRNSKRIPVAVLGKVLEMEMVSLSILIRQVMLIDTLNIGSSVQVVVGVFAL